MPTYASNIDYGTLYGTGNPIHRGAKKGIPPFLPAALVGFCRTNGLSALFDISGDNGELCRRIAEFGLSAAFSNVVPREGDIRFDLAQGLERLRADLGEQPYLATCLDVLEHIDLEDLSAALEAVHALSHDWLLFSTSSQPSTDHNRFHATILPLPMWISLLAEAGFDLITADVFPEIINNEQSEVTQNEDTFIIDHWKAMDPFKDVGNEVRRYVLLRKRAPELRGLGAMLGPMLDLGFLRRKRQQFDWRPSRPFCLAVNSMQDVQSFTPLLQALPRQDVHIMLRRHVLPRNYELLVRAKWERCGLIVHPYERAEDLDLSWMRGGTWVSATESTMWLIHQLGLHAVNHAKLAGLRSILFQHGIWAESTPGRSITFASDFVVTWGKRERTDFEGQLTTVAGRPIPRGTYGDSTAVPLGSSKFADALVEISPDYVYRRFGINPKRYSRVVLVGLNLHWNVHRSATETILDQIWNGFLRQPETYFIVKAHPAQGPSLLGGRVAPNCILVDDHILSCLDLTMSRLIKSVDLVMSTLSTLLLDAAVAGTPFIQIDTEASLNYDGVTSSQIDEAFQKIHQKLWPKPTPDFIDGYAEASEGDFYGDFAEFLRRTEPDGSLGLFNHERSVVLAMGSEMECLWLSSVKQ